MNIRHFNVELPLFSCKCHYLSGIITKIDVSALYRGMMSFPPEMQVYYRLRSFKLKYKALHAGTVQITHLLNLFQDPRQLLRYAQQLVQGELHHLAVDDVVVCLSQIASSPMLERRVAFDLSFSSSRVVGPELLAVGQGYRASLLLQVSLHM